MKKGCWVPNSHILGVRQTAGVSQDQQSPGLTGWIGQSSRNNEVQRGTKSGQGKVKGQRALSCSPVRKSPQAVRELRFSTLETQLAQVGGAEKVSRAQVLKARRPGPSFSQQRLQQAGQKAQATSVMASAGCGISCLLVLPITTFPL